MNFIKGWVVKEAGAHNYMAYFGEKDWSYESSIRLAKIFTTRQEAQEAIYSLKDEILEIEFTYNVKLG